MVFLALSSLFVLSACSDDATNAYVVKVSDIVELHGEIDNREHFEQFFEHEQQGKDDTIRIVRYTIESNPILYNYPFENNKIQVTIDNKQDSYGEADELINKMTSKPRLVVVTAMEGNQVIGYKMGYELDTYTFYSWLGGVRIKYRKYGIASKLMEIQHQYVREQGYHVVQTKTMNKWRNMLILNIKSGFDVMSTYTDKNGLHKIVLEKKLL